MEIKTSQEILDDMEKADDGCAVTDGTHWDVKWVAIEQLKPIFEMIGKMNIMKFGEGLSLLIALIGTFIGWYYRHEVLLLGVCLLVLMLIYNKLSRIENSV